MMRIHVDMMHAGLSQAKELLFAGCSAGGLTTYVHADWVTETMKTRAPQVRKNKSTSRSVS
jgi:hypothetical protein